MQERRPGLFVRVDARQSRGRRHVEHEDLVGVVCQNPVQVLRAYRRRLALDDPADFSHVARIVLFAFLHCVSSRWRARRGPNPADAGSVSESRAATRDRERIGPHRVAQSGSDLALGIDEDDDHARPARIDGMRCVGTGDERARRERRPCRVLAYLHGTVEGHDQVPAVVRVDPGFGAGPHVTSTGGQGCKAPASDSTPGGERGSSTPR